MPSTAQVKKQRYHARLAEGLCPLCGRVREEKSKRLCKDCRNKAKVFSTKARAGGKSARTYTSKLRREVIAIYGGKCLRCGFTDWRALQLDHIKGDGYKEKHRYYYGFLKQLIANPDFEKFQLLCANCNWIKRHENNENPNVSPAA